MNVRFLHQGEATEVQVYPLQNSDRRHFHEKGYTRLQHDEWLHYPMRGTDDNSQTVEEPCEVNVSSTVLKRAT